jgi:formylglycine-generating enzyme required for sulfatase activity
MAGNVWEWCETPDPGRQDDGDLVDSHMPRAVRGGSFMSVNVRVRSTFHYYLNPLYRYATIGFRVIAPGD